MIKRELHTAITNIDIEEVLDHISGETKIVSHVVDSLGTHYIITETQVPETQEPENEIQKLEQLIKSTQDHFMDDLYNCVDNMNFYYSQGIMTDYREYVKQYDGIMKRYGERLKDLRKQLDKLKQS